MTYQSSGCVRLTSRCRPPPCEQVTVKLHNAEETNVQAYTLEKYDSFGPCHTRGLSTELMSRSPACLTPGITPLLCVCAGEMALVDPEHQFYLESYMSDAHCEIMLLLKDDFDRLLHRYVFERLKLRYIALKKLRIFQVRSTPLDSSNAS